MANLFGKKATQLGVYFSQDNAYLAQIKGNEKPQFFSISVTREQVNLNFLFIDEAKTAALLQEEFGKLGVKGADISVALNARDLVMRYFELPFMPASEIENAIMFESKRYLPFKVEEVYYDYQYLLNKKERKLNVFFVGIKKEIIDQYFSVFKTLNCSIAKIEPAHFSILKVLNFDKVVSPFAVIDASSNGANISVISDGFIFFSRDLNMPSIDPKAKEEATSSANLLMKFINETRVSLDYYRRQPSSKPVKNIIYVCEPELKEWSETLSKELDINIKCVTTEEIKNIRETEGMGPIKAFAVSTSTGKSISTINLANKRSFLVAKPIKSKSVCSTAISNFAVNIFANTIIRYSIFFAVIAIGIVYGYSYQQQMPFAAKLTELKNQIPTIKIDMIYTSNDDLSTIEKKNLVKITDLKKASVTRKFITPLLNNLVKLVPRGVWLNEMSFSISGNEDLSMRILGKVYLKDEAKELQAINSLLNFIKQDPEFGKTFKSIEMGAVNSAEKIGEARITSFEINCK